MTQGVQKVTGSIPPTPPVRVGGCEGMNVDYYCAEPKLNLYNIQLRQCDVT